MIIIKAVVLAALIKLLLETENPALCAGLYTVFAGIIGLAFGIDLRFLWISVLLAFGLSFGYFWLLDRLDGSPLFWVVLIVGLLIGVV